MVGSDEWWITLFRGVTFALPLNLTALFMSSTESDRSDLRLS